jgi:phenylpropionate dioxygenase-like ring-hydroxylating dioxygenase large terminal subunit
MTLLHADPDDTLPRDSIFAPDDWRILARFWYPVALARDLGAKPIATFLLDEPLVIYRAGEEVIVARDICPHRGVPLSLGTQRADGVACAYHGLRFGEGGRCTHIPAQPRSAIPPRMRLHTYPAVERYGLIWTCLRPEPGAAPDICPMPHWDDAAFQTMICPYTDIAGFAGRQVEGFLDVAHFAFVHPETFGDPENTEVPDYKPQRHAHGFDVDYVSTVGRYPIGLDERGREGFRWLRRFNCHLPFTATLTIHFPDDGRLVIMNAASPMSARRTRLFAPIARNYDKDLPVEDAYDFNLKIFEEDRAIVESQRPEWLPLLPNDEAHILADRSSMAYRRGLRDLGLGRFFSA